MILYDADDRKRTSTEINPPAYSPARDFVEVVRCKNCKFRDTFDCGMQFYGYDDDGNLCKSDDWTDDDGFCYWGERKEPCTQ